MGKSAPKAGSTRARVRALAMELLASAPEGLRYSELLEGVREQLPGTNPQSIPSALVHLMKDLPEEITKTAPGFYMHTRHALSEDDGDAGEPDSAQPDGDEEARSGTVREEEFYASFAAWLESDLEECTRAIALGGSVFRDKWGTPDVIGVREARRSDILTFPTEIVSAEIKVNTSALITAFGQACAYRLFSHRSYLVVPAASSEGDVARLDVLARLVGLGLVLFDATSPALPRYSIRVRAAKHEPDGFYVNRCLKLVEKELFG